MALKILILPFVFVIACAQQQNSTTRNASGSIASSNQTPENESASENQTASPNSANTPGTPTPEPNKLSGMIDTDFGVNGYAFVASSFSTLTYHGVTEIAAQSDGKLLAVGVVQSQTGFGLFRFNKNGSLDTTYGSGGNAILPASTFPANITSVIVDTSNRAYVFCTIRNDAMNTYDLSLMRFLPTGSLDSAFATNGIYKFAPVSNLMSSPAGMKLSSGKLMLSMRFAEEGSSTTRNFTRLMRMNLDATIDLSFNGIGYIDINDSLKYAIGFEIDASDRVVYFGENSDGGCGLRRFLPNGALDTSFAGGTVTFRYSATSAIEDCRKVKVDSQSNIYAGGASVTYLSRKLTIAKFTNQGVIDIAFGTNGVFMEMNHTSNPSMNSIFIDSSERLFMFFQVGREFKISQLTKAGVLEASYGMQGIASITLPQTGDWVSSRPFVLSPTSILLPGYFNHVFGILAIK